MTAAVKAMLGGMIATIVVLLGIALPLIAGAIAIRIGVPLPLAALVGLLVAGAEGGLLAAWVVEPLNEK